MSDQKNVLIFVYIPTHFREMIRVARLLKSTKRYQPIILFKAAYEFYENDVNLCRKEEITVIEPNDIFSCTSSTTALSEKPIRNFRLVWTLKLYKQYKKANKNLFAKFFYVAFLYLMKLSYGFKSFGINFLKKTPYFLLAGLLRICSFLKVGEIIKKVVLTSRFNPPFFNIFHSCYDYLCRNWLRFLPSTTQNIHLNYNVIPDFLNLYNIKLIILPEDNIFYLTHFFVHFAKKNNIATIIIPFTIVNVQEWAECFCSDPAAHVTHSAINFFVAQRYPHWALTYKNVSLILPVQYVLAYEYFKLRMAQPWLINSGQADAIAVESSFMKNYYLQAGLEETKLVVTGAIYDDELYEKFLTSKIVRDELYKELEIANDLPILLCALPPNQPVKDRMGCDFESYEEIIRFWLETLAKYNHQYNIIVNLHPRINSRDIQFLGEYNIKISDRNIAELVPLCSIYVACCSATIRMAIGCGIPVINYDVYRYGYNDYNQAKGVLTFQGRSEFINAVDSIINDEIFFQTVTANQQEIMKDWAMLDGGSGQRIIDLIDSFAK